MAKKTVLIIGAGMGGLVAAAHLARQGFLVTVLERNDEPGGRCYQLEREGHRFDTGPTLLVMPKLYEAEFNALGSSMRKTLDLIPVDPTYHLHFDDGSQLALTADQVRMKTQLEAIAPGSFVSYQRYIKEAGRHYDVGVPNFVGNDFRRAWDFFNPHMLQVMMQVHPFALHYSHMRHFFDEPRLKAAFTFQDVYMGLSPYEAPATFSLMAYTELAHGVFYPRGGMGKIVEAVAELARQAGVEFKFDAEVVKILTAGDKASGVLLLDGEVLMADLILANADLPYVYEKLLPSSHQARVLSGKRYSCSTLSFFWGVDKVYEQLPPHTLFLSKDYRANFDAITRTQDVPKNSSLYVHAPARLDPAMAPAGQDTLIAILPIGHLLPQEQDWPAVRDEARRQVFSRLKTLGIDDLERHIKFESYYNPLSWRKRYNLAKGATHGLSHNLLQLAWFRPGNRHDEYRNLYFAGASTRPGTGLPTAMVSGRLAAQRIIDEQG
jgi:phytoene desaturase